MDSLTKQLKDATEARAKAEAEAKAATKSGSGLTDEEIAEREKSYKELESKKVELVGELKAATAAGTNQIRRI